MGAVSSVYKKNGKGRTASTDTDPTYRDALYTDPVKQERLVSESHQHLSDAQILQYTTPKNQGSLPSELDELFVKEYSTNQNVSRDKELRR